MQVTLDGGRQVALAVWDTAGSPHFQHVSRLYIRGADVILVCYDITSRNNWERLKLWVSQPQGAGCRWDLPHSLLQQ